jgi:hypothetical protein
MSKLPNKLVIALVLSSLCGSSIAATNWTQDEIIVKPRGEDAVGNTIPNDLTYKFVYKNDELSSVNMIFKSFDAVNQYDVLVGSHYFKYETLPDASRRLKTILLFNQGNQIVKEDKEQLSQKYTLTEMVSSPLFDMRGKWILVISERDEKGRAIVVNKFGINDTLKIKMIENVNASRDPLDSIDFDAPYIGTPIGAFLISYADPEKTDFKEVRTYSFSEASCDTCPPPPVKNPVGSYLYEPKIDYVWDYKSNGDFTTTFNFHIIDAVSDHITPLYQQDIKFENINPESGRVQRFTEFANNIYNLAANAKPVPVYEYHLKDEKRPSPIIDEYLFGLSMMSIGTAQEDRTDINFSSIIDTSPDSTPGEMDDRIDALEEYFNGLAGVISGGG